MSNWREAQQKRTTAIKGLFVIVVVLECIIGVLIIAALPYAFN